jgi:hypothetical protein
MRPALFTTLLTVALLAPSGATAAEPPAWLARAAQLPAAPIDNGADAVVLLDDLQVTVGTDGRVVSRRQYAVRILTRAGAEAATLREVYTTDSGDVRAMRGWVISRSTATQLGREHTADVAIVSDDVYNEARVRIVSASSDVQPGDVFGAETEVAERTVFTQFEWPLQEEWPVRSVRRALALPSGWEARAITFNRAPLETARSGDIWSWTAADLEPPPQETAGPSPSGLLPRLAVSYFDRPDSPTSFGDWAGVSKWLARLAEPQGVTNAAITAKTRELTAGAATDLDRIRAIARYVQNVQYISIQTGVGRGGGYKPRAAADVFARNYGDCKDKANLMRTMLASIGVTSHSVAIYAGDPDYVRPEWPSPQQFNHAIIAIAVAPGTSPASTVTHPALGTLLFFDPTDEQTPVGSLPLHEQGSHALVITASGGALVPMPTADTADNPSARQVQATLGPAGELTATIVHNRGGERASAERQLFATLPRDDYRRLLETEVRRQIPGATLTLGTVTDDAANNQFAMTLRVEATAYAQVVQKLLLVRPPQLIRLNLATIGSGVRRTPIIIEPLEERDALDIALPPGTSVDELPEPRALETAFGSFSVRWEAGDGRVTRTLSLRLRRTRMPPDAARDVRTFFEAFREAEQLPLVLARP